MTLELEYLADCGFAPGRPSSYSQELLARRMHSRGIHRGTIFTHRAHRNESGNRPFRKRTLIALLVAFIIVFYSGHVLYGTTGRGMREPGRLGSSIGSGVPQTVPGSTRDLRDVDGSSQKSDDLTQADTLGGAAEEDDQKSLPNDGGESRILDRYMEPTDVEEPSSIDVDPTPSSTAAATRSSSQTQAATPTSSNTAVVKATPSSTVTATLSPVRTMDPSVTASVSAGPTAAVQGRESVAAEQMTALPPNPALSGLPSVADLLRSYDLFIPSPRRWVVDAATPQFGSMHPWAAGDVDCPGGCLMHWSHGRGGDADIRCVSQ